MKKKTEVITATMDSEAVYDLARLASAVKDNVSGRRFQHITGVRYTAACMAMRYGENVNHAEACGLLHDYVKDFSDTKMLNQCRKHSLSIRPVEERNPYLLHGLLAAHLAEEEFGVTDHDLLNAIIYHTTGRPKMSQMEKILFVADFMEPGRKPVPGLDDVRAMTFVDLDKAVLLELTATVGYLDECKESGKRAEIDERTIDAYRYYKEHVIL